MVLIEPNQKRFRQKRKLFVPSIDLGEKNQPRNQTKINRDQSDMNHKTIEPNGEETDIEINNEKQDVVRKYRDIPVRKNGFQRPLKFKQFVVVIDFCFTVAVFVQETAFTEEDTFV